MVYLYFSGHGDVWAFRDSKLSKSDNFNKYPHPQGNFCLQKDWKMAQIEGKNKIFFKNSPAKIENELIYDS